MRSLQDNELFALSHYEYGEAYYGSLSGMRFCVAREPLQDVHYTPVDRREEAVLRVVCWPEPDSFRTAPEASKISKDFPFTEAGLQEARVWLNTLPIAGI